MISGSAYSNIKYQLVLIGNESKFSDTIVQTFLKRIKELGIVEASINVIEKENFFKDPKGYNSKSPTVGLYFGGDDSVHPNLDILDKLIKDACYVIPVVDDKSRFTDYVPEEIHSINGFQLNINSEINSLINRVLECFSLLRETRRLFISYKRSESTGIAIQLYEHLDKSGYDVFLDTHNILAGEKFQEELWHRLVDTDVVILLHTPNFLDSVWTTEELVKASSMSVGIVQIIWPNHKPSSIHSLDEPFQLEEVDFIKNNYSDSNGKLVNSIVDEIGCKIEAFRARCLASRQDNLIQEFLSSSRKFSVKAVLHPEKFISVLTKDSKQIEIIPTIGVPHAFTYNKTEELIKSLKKSSHQPSYVLFDHRNIKERWINHLTWLDKHLPIKSLKITEIENFLNDI